MKIIKIDKKELTANEWDGGKTYENFIYPPEAKYSESNFLFQVSSATIEKFLHILHVLKIIIVFC